MTDQAARAIVGFVAAIVLSSTLLNTANAADLAGFSATGLRELLQDPKRSVQLEGVSLAEAAAFVGQKLGAAPDREERLAWLESASLLLHRIGFYGKGPFFNPNWPWAQAEYRKLLAVVVDSWEEGDLRAENSVLETLAGCNKKVFGDLADAKAVAARTIECLYSGDKDVRLAAARAATHLWRVDGWPPCSNWPEQVWQYPTDSEKSLFDRGRICAEHPDICRQLDRIDDDSGDCPAAIWLIGQIRCDDSEELIEAKLDDPALKPRLAFALEALKHIDARRYEQVIPERAAQWKALILQAAKDDAIPADYLLAQLQTYAPDETASWLRGVLYDKNSAPEVRALIVPLLYSRHEPWAQNILVAWMSTRNELPGWPQAIVPLVYAERNGEGWRDLVSQYLEHRIRTCSDETLRLNYYEGRLFDLLAYGGHAADLPLLLAAAEKANTPADMTYVSVALRALLDHVPVSETALPLLDYAESAAAGTFQRQMAVQAFDPILDRLEPSERPRLVTFMRTCLTDPVCAHLAARSLAKLGDTPSIPDIASLPCLDNPLLAPTIIDSLAAFGARHANTELMRLFDQAKSPQLRTYIALHLSRSLDPRVPKFAAKALARETDRPTRIALQQCVDMAPIPPVISMWQAIVVIVALAVLIMVILRRMLIRQRDKRAKLPP